MPRPISVQATVFSLVIPFLLWPLAFQEVLADFWTSLAAATLMLLASALLLNKKLEIRLHFPWMIVGIASGFLLYAFFYSGFQIIRGMEPFSGGVSSIYSLKAERPLLLIALLLIFPIAPAEEIYWRGLVQKAFADAYDPTVGLLLSTAAYTLVHLFTLNPPLLITAFVGGLAWGALYKASGSLMPGILSHIVFNLLIFVVAPLS